MLQNRSETGVSFHLSDRVHIEYIKVNNKGVRYQYNCVHEMYVLLKNPKSQALQNKYTFPSV